MHRDEVLRLFEAHREAEASRDHRRHPRDVCRRLLLGDGAARHPQRGTCRGRKAYEAQFFTASPDLAPDDEGIPFGDDVIAVWGTLRGTSRGDWLGVPPGGGSFAVPFANLVRFRDGLMAGERVYFDLATPCEQACIPLHDVRSAAAARAASS